MNYDVGVYLEKFRNLPAVPHVNSPENSRIAVIIEPRKAYFLSLVIRNFMSILKGWNLCVIDGENNHDWVTDQLQGWQFQHIKLDIANMTTTFYSALLKSSSFWNIFKEEHILIFQLDTVLLRDIPLYLLQYDMVGAPCGDLRNFVMNGGLSLRKKSAMLSVINKNFHPSEIEDIFFSKYVKKPSIEVCEVFVENYVKDEKTVIGIHGTDKPYLHPTVYETLLNKNY